MKYLLDASGYVKSVYFGCGAENAIEYAGVVPTGYDSLEDWMDNARIEAYKVNVSGNLVLDTEKESTLPPKSEYRLPKFLLDAIYPIGSIYITANSADPATYLGGTWSQIKDRFLYAVGDTSESGQSGGSAEITIPAHKHVSPVFTRNSQGQIFVTSKYGYETGHSATGSKAAVSSSNNTTQYNDCQVHMTSEAAETSASNLPPYVRVLMWRRTA